MVFYIEGAAYTSKQDIDKKMNVKINSTVINLIKEDNLPRTLKDMG